MLDRTASAQVDGRINLVLRSSAEIEERMFGAQGGGAKRILSLCLFIIAKTPMKLLRVHVCEARTWAEIYQRTSCEVNNSRVRKSLAITISVSSSVDTLNWTLLRRKRHHVAMAQRVCYSKDPEMYLLASCQRPKEQTADIGVYIYSSEVLLVLHSHWLSRGIRYDPPPDHIC